MNMELISLNKSEYLKDIESLAGDEFLQANFWFELLKNNKENVEIFGVKEGEKILASILIIKKPLIGPWFYYYGPRGPRGEDKAIKFLLVELKKKKSEAVFLRIEPGEINDELKKLKLTKSIDLQPKKTLFLDLNLGVEKLLADMHQKTRYNIRLAEKKGVEIKEADKNSDEDFNEFWRLMSLTSERDDFRIHGAEHYKNLLKSENIKLFFASHEGKKITAALFCFYSSRVTYMHGASDNEARNLMAPYLLQWEIIKKAQKDGYKYYDFYGIDEKKWPGVTRFKLGFGGFVKEYPGTHDFIFRSGIYNLYEFLRKIRRTLKFLK